MKRCAMLTAVVLFAAMIGLGALGGPAMAAETHIHYFVVPTQAVGGLTFIEAMDQFKVKLAELAGGYTELGLSNGGSIAGGALSKEINFSFLVAASSNISADLALLIPQYFNESSPFILHWTGDMYTGAR